MADQTTRNRFDLAELGGAFDDLGTLIQFIVAYVSILKMDPAGIRCGDDRCRLLLQDTFSGSTD